MEKESSKSICYFVTFCIEQYKRSKGMSGSDVVTFFDQYGVLEYLSNNYETLHTQDYRWVLDDIDQYIANRQ